jgi:hypothetical protein
LTQNIMYNELAYEIVRFFERALNFGRRKSSLFF